jgi:membrane-associated phospholipid phosphatase
MEIYSNNSTDIAIPVPAHTRKLIMARWVSNVFCPPVLAVAGIFLISFQLASLAAWLWSGFIFLGSIASPLGYILFQLKRGKVSDFEIYHREQRKGSYIFTLVCGTITLLVMWLFAAPILIITLGAASLLQVGIMFLINTRWKISAHAAAMALFVTLLVYLFGRPLLPTTVGIPLMVWSRVSLRRHTLLQTLAGSALGISILAMCLLAIQ